MNKIKQVFISTTDTGLKKRFISEPFQILPFFYCYKINTTLVDKLVKHEPLNEKGKNKDKNAFLCGFFDNWLLKIIYYHFSCQNAGIFSTANITGSYAMLYSHLKLF